MDVPNPSSPPPAGQPPPWASSFWTTHPRDPSTTGLRQQQQKQPSTSSPRKRKRGSDHGHDHDHANAYAYAYDQTDPTDRRLNPRSHGPATLHQFRLAGYADDQAIPSQRWPAFPHRPPPLSPTDREKDLHRRRRRSRRRRRPSRVRDNQTSDGDDDTDTNYGAYRSTRGETSLEDDYHYTYPLESEAESQSPHADVDLTEKPWPRSFHFLHNLDTTTTTTSTTTAVNPRFLPREVLLPPLVNAIRLLLERGQVRQAKQVFAVAVRAVSRAKHTSAPPDVRKYGLWSLGAEILMREGEEQQPATETNLRWGRSRNMPRVREYFQSLIHQFPWTHTTKDKLCAPHFWVALLRCELYDTYQEHAHVNRNNNNNNNSPDSSTYDAYVAQEQARTASLRRIQDLTATIRGLLEAHPFPRFRDLWEVYLSMQLYLLDLAIPSPRPRTESQTGPSINSEQSIDAELPFTDRRREEEEQDRWEALPIQSLALDRAKEAIERIRKLDGVIPEAIRKCILDEDSVDHEHSAGHQDDHRNRMVLQESDDIDTSIADSVNEDTSIVDSADVGAVDHTDTSKTNKKGKKGKKSKKERKRDKKKSKPPNRMEEEERRVETISTKESEKSKDNAKSKEKETSKGKETSKEKETKKKKSKKAKALQNPPQNENPSQNNAPAKNTPSNQSSSRYQPRARKANAAAVAAAIIDIDSD